MRRHRDHQHGRRVQSPPWWPEGEAWPPTDRMEADVPWRHMRRRFLWRFAAAIVFLVALAVSGALLLSWLVGTLAGAGGPPRGGPPGFARLLLSVLVVAIVVFVARRAYRRLAEPVGNLVEAAGRVESGDYGARVPETGSRELRALAHAFNAMAARLETNEEQRRTLLADVSHELRTPLTVIQGNLEAVLDGVYRADAEHLQPILEETRVMSRLVDDLRTLALSEAGALTLHREPTDLGALLHEVKGAFRPTAEAHGVELRNEIEPALPLFEIDPGRIREVVANLLTNALRHTPRGGTVTVALGRHGRHHVRVEVRDTGPGIPRERLERIFDRFTKSPESRGSGLGLAIARNLITAHGGEMSAESPPGGGATIRFTLPVDDRQDVS